MMHNIGGAARQRIFDAGREAEAARLRALVEREEALEASREAARVRFAETVKQVAEPWRKIVSEVCSKYDVTFEAMSSTSRIGHLNPPRQECFYRLFSETTMSQPAIGRRFNRDHTTVIHGIKKHASVNGLPLAKDLKWAAGLASRMDTSRLPRQSRLRS